MYILIITFFLVVIFVLVILSGWILYKSIKFYYAAKKIPTVNINALKNETKKANIRIFKALQSGKTHFFLRKYTPACIKNNPNKVTVEYDYQKNSLFIDYRFQKKVINMKNYSRVYDENTDNNN